MSLLTNLLPNKPRFMTLCVVVFVVLSLMFYIAFSWGIDRLEKRIHESAMLAATEYGVGLGVQDTSLRVFALTPSVTLSGVSAGMPEQNLALIGAEIEGRVSWADIVKARFHGVEIQVKKGSVSVVVAEDGSSNWDALLDAFFAHDASEQAEFSIGSIHIAGTDLSYANARLSQNGSFYISGVLMPLGDDGISTLEVSGDLNGYVFEAAALLDDNASSPLHIELRLAELAAELKTDSAHFYPSLELSGSLSVDGKNVGELLNELNIANTHVADVTASVDFSIDNGIYLVEEAVFKAGRSDVVLSARMDTASLPVQISGDIASSFLAVDELIGVGIDPLATQPLPSSASARTRVFSSSPFSADAWFSELLGTIRVELESVSRAGTKMNDVQILTSFDSGTLTLDADSGSFAGGSIDASLTIEASSDGVIGSRSAKASFKAQQVKLHDALALSGVTSSAGKGSLSGEGTFWVKGFSPTTVAASLDGGMFVVVEDGELDALLVEMAGIDFVESISLLIKRDLQQTQIRCGFMDLQASSGVLAVKDFIIDTEDSLFLADGAVDFNKESVSLKFSPHPRDASFLAAPTSLVVSGTLASPSFKPGKSLLSRLAVAGALASLAGPAALVLPFIEIGFGDGESGCYQLFNQ